MMMRVGGVAAVLALGLVAGLWLMAPSNLPVRQVHLHGTLRHLDPSQIEEVVAGTLHGNMVTQDLDGLERRLEEHAWVRQARIHRDWPATLRIEVVEQVPVARWEAGGLLNAWGERFALRNDPEPSLVGISGMPGREAALIGMLGRLNSMLEPRGMRLARLEETRFHSLHLTMRSGLRLTLGRVRPIERLARWLRYYEAYARTAPAREMIIDLRYPNGFSARSSTNS